MGEEIRGLDPISLLLKPNQRPGKLLLKFSDHYRSKLALENSPTLIEVKEPSPLAKAPSTSVEIKLKSVPKRRYGSRSKELEQGNPKGKKPKREVETKKKTGQKKGRKQKGKVKEEVQGERPPSSPSKLQAWAVASALKNPALNRAMEKIKQGFKENIGMKRPWKYTGEK